MAVSAQLLPLIVDLLPLPRVPLSHHQQTIPSLPLGLTVLHLHHITILPHHLTIISPHLTKILFRTTFTPHPLPTSPLHLPQTIQASPPLDTAGLPQSTVHPLLNTVHPLVFLLPRTYFPPSCPPVSLTFFPRYFPQNLSHETLSPLHLPLPLTSHLALGPNRTPPTPSVAAIF